MRLFLVSSAALSLSLVSGVAIAAPPTTVFDVGSFQSAKLAPGADATAIEQAARVVLAERVPAANGLAFVSSPATFLRDGRRIAKLRQTHAGLPVIDRSATVTFDAKGVAHIIAAKIANELPADVTPAQMERWVKDMDNWALVDTACFHYWDRSPHAFARIEKWSKAKDEFVKRAAFALLRRLAASGAVVAALAAVADLRVEDAELVAVEIGRTSVTTVEIVKGLKVGDKVIVSDTSQLGDNVTRIRLN